MNNFKLTVCDGKLVVDFPNEYRRVHISGEYENDVFRIRTEHFETYGELSKEDKRRIRQAIDIRNNKGVKPMIIID